MDKILYLLRGGFAKDYRTQIIGVATAFGVLIAGLAKWAVGDATLFDALKTVDWTQFSFFLGLATLGQKINNRG